MPTNEVRQRRNFCAVRIENCADGQSVEKQQPEYRPKSRRSEIGHALVEVAKEPIRPRIILAFHCQLGRVNKVGHLRIFETAQVVTHAPVRLRPGKNIRVSLAREKDIFRERHSSSEGIVGSWRRTLDVQQTSAFHFVVASSVRTHTQRPYITSREANFRFSVNLKEPNITVVYPEVYARTKAESFYRQVGEGEPSLNGNGERRDISIQRCTRAGDLVLATRGDRRIYNGNDKLVSFSNGILY